MQLYTKAPTTRQCINAHRSNEFRGFGLDIRHPDSDGISTSWKWMLALKHQRQHCRLQAVYSLRGLM
jgi:hypothetical protein